MPLDPTILNPSLLRHIVEVQILNRTGDQWAVTDASLVITPSTGWTTVYTGYAAIESLGGLTAKEVLRDEDLASVSTHLITMRFSPSFTVTPGMQIRYGSKAYRVQIARNWDERNIAWKILCVEVPAS